jgi:hypothetical protein
MVFLLGRQFERAIEVVTIFGSTRFTDPLPGALELRLEFGVVGRDLVAAGRLDQEEFFTGLDVKAGERLEKWPVTWFETLLPRHMEIIHEIHRRLLEEVRTRFPRDEGKDRASFLPRPSSFRDRDGNPDSLDGTNADLEEDVQQHEGEAIPGRVIHAVVLPLKPNERRAFVGNDTRSLEA